MVGSSLLGSTSCKGGSVSRDSTHMSVAPICSKSCTNCVTQITDVRDSNWQSYSIWISRKNWRNIQVRVASRNGPWRTLPDVFTAVLLQIRVVWDITSCLWSGQSTLVAFVRFEAFRDKGHAKLSQFGPKQDSLWEPCRPSWCCTVSRLDFHWLSPLIIILSIQW